MKKLSSVCSSPIKAACTPIEVRILARSWISELSREEAKEQLVNQTHLRNIEGAYDLEGLKMTRPLAVKLKHLSLLTN